jgi:hypothetical protein
MVQEKFSRFGHSDAHFDDVLRDTMRPFLDSPSLYSDGNPVHGFDFRVDPAQAGLWSAFTYYTQYLKRFFEALPSGQFSEANSREPIPAPQKLVVVLPNTPGDASKAGREDFASRQSLRWIVFGKDDKRTALLSSDGETLYDIPSIIDSFAAFETFSTIGGARQKSLSSFHTGLLSLLKNDGDFARRRVEIQQL